MPRRKKGTVRKGHGVMCNICGTNCGKGGALKKHIQGEHKVDYINYKMCFYKNAKTIIADSWDDSVKTHGGKDVIVHVMVRRFVGHSGKRGATRAARLLK